MKKIYHLLVVLVFQACTSDIDEALLPDEIEISKVTTWQAADGKYDLLGFSCGQ